VRWALISAVYCCLITAACGGGGASGGNGGGGNGAQPTSSGVLITTVVDSAQCKAAPPDLVDAIQAKMGSFTLTHAFEAADGDFAIVAGRLGGPGRSGTDIATFAVQGADDPATATVYALGPNAAQSSEWQEASTDTEFPVGLDDAQALIAAGCAKAG
jgi:hypothetical protein